jgi:glycosyltransferase involved in cell wall biosynthesis
MRVGFDARWYNDSGVGTYVAELLRAMAPMQRDCELIVYEHADNRVPGLEELSLKRIEVTAGRYSPAGMAAMGRRFREDRLDVFHSPFYPLPWFAGARAPCALVVTVHDLIPFLFPVGGWAKRRLVKAGYRRAARVAGEIVTGSRRSALDVENILGVTTGRISVTPYAVSSTDFRADGGRCEQEVLAGKFGVKEPYVVVTSARNWKTKNLETALQVAEKAQQMSGTEFMVVIHGPPDGLDAAGGAEKWRHLNLVRTGHLPAMELAMLYRHAHLYVMPSLYEGFGLPLVDAMACGCPVVASSGGSLKEVAGDGAQVFDPTDVNGMATAVAGLLLHKQSRERWGAAGLHRAAEFSWNTTAQQTMAVYHRAYQNHRAYQKRARK